MTTTPSISVESPHAAGIPQLLERGAAYAHSLYPAGETNVQLELSELDRTGVSIYVARADDGAAIGLVALIEDVEHGAGRAELARLFVDEAFRGRGIAALLLMRAETDAMARGVRELVLQTGTAHLAAQALYAKHGYRRVDPFGRYVGVPASVCMAKSLLGFGAAPLTDLPLAVGE
ncbi:GNAT family N-acetyltransferase [Agromyces marinus]|uniref:N-acetyltransferase domain-containing protein n=1 Tax=Agromyces marinus TaxID=1389020 RepID=A0ABM8H355_9MICO|nr:GNAT family N-acetyltransferase [Agromyces marinus]UIP59695.1 hypothetical protein DSM26151_26090 [Agromyces marinus]BDZ55229.1 hypothetical protein GCM10025870_23020 [Agromyces marinus]